jgi:hypothetical protein
MKAFIDWIKSFFTSKPADVIPIRPVGYRDYSAADVDAATKFFQKYDPKITRDQVLGSPWMLFMWKYDGLNEAKASKEFAKRLWDNTSYDDGQDDQTLAGDKYAWCKATTNTAYAEAGVSIKGHLSAAAKDLQTFGRECGFIFGAGLPVRHKSKVNFHVNFFIAWKDKARKLAYCSGGNQGNKLCVVVYDFSGNDNGKDEVYPSPRWPNDFPLPGESKPSTPMKSIILPWEAKDSSRSTWTAKVLVKLDQHFAVFDAAKDAHEYHPGYSALTTEQRKHVWANMICSIAKFESGWDPKSRMTESSGDDSVGLLQLSKGEIDGDLENPLDNLGGGIDIMAKLIKRDGVIASGGYEKYGAPPAKGAARYWSVLRVPDSKREHHKADIQKASKEI